MKNKDKSVSCDTPAIKIISIKDKKECEVDFESDEKTFKLIEDYGRKVATREDFIQIGFRQILKDTVKHAKKVVFSQKKNK